MCKKRSMVTSSLQGAVDLIFFKPLFLLNFVGLGQPLFVATKQPFFKSRLTVLSDPQAEYSLRLFDVHTQPTSF